MAEAVAEKSIPEFKRGVKAGIGIGIGYFPVALTFGLLAKATDLNVMETLLMSMIVFAGAAQYIALSLISLGTGMFEIILTTFIVNIRHFLLSASLNEKAADDHPAFKAVYAFGITDETFSLAAMRDGTVTAGYMFGLNLVAYSSWVVFSGIGHVLGAGLPQVLQESMSVALYAMFIGLLVPSLKKNVKIVFLAVLAAAFNTIFTMSEFLSSGWSIVVSTLLAAILTELIETGKRLRGGRADGQ